jgi:citrate lyase beta subunit
MFAASCLLFVPGSRPDRFGKAMGAGADCVVIDLEDAVAEGDKAAARAAALARISDGGDFAIRINAVGTAHGLADILALQAARVAPRALLVPMVETAAELAIVAAVLADPAIVLVPLIETAAGLRAAADIAAAPQVGALMFGGGDLAGELGVALAWEPLLTARSLVVLAAAGARVPAIDVPFLGFDDPQGLAAETARARALGFAAKAAIHPAQVPVIAGVMRPSAADMAEAQAAIAAYEAGGRRAIRHAGRMLEAPIIRRYERVLAAGRMDANA